MTRKRQNTLFQTMIQRADLPQAIRALSFCVSWAIAQQATKDAGPLTLTRYSEYWKQSRTTTWREQQAFEACFPGRRFPGDVVEKMGLDASSEDRDEIAAQFVAATAAL